MQVSTELPEDTTPRVITEKTFDWPCDRRVAHGPHHVEQSGDEFTIIDAYDCDGVKAHPSTMIGRQAT